MGRKLRPSWWTEPESLLSGHQQPVATGCFRVMCLRTR